MDDLPADLVVNLPEGSEPVARQWWASLSDDERRRIVGLWDERLEVLDWSFRCLRGRIVSQGSAPPPSRSTRCHYRTALNTSVRPGVAAHDTECLLTAIGRHWSPERDRPIDQRGPPDSAHAGNSGYTTGSGP